MPAYHVGILALWDIQCFMAQPFPTSRTFTHSSFLVFFVVTRVREGLCPCGQAHGLYHIYVP